MKWFKHMTDAHDSNDLTKVRVRYGADGYAVYWYCLELIAADLGERNNITFELRHDADVIGHNLKIDAAKVEEMMRYMVKIGLFEQAGGIVTCLKLAKYLDKKSTRNETIHRIIDVASSLSRTVPDNSGLSGLDTDTDTDTDTDVTTTPVVTSNKTETLSGSPPDASPSTAKKNGYNQTARGVLEFLNEKTGRNYQPVKANLDMIVARLKEGATERHLRLVVLRKFHDWGSDEKMAEYLRPATLFNRTKFAQYVGEIPKEQSDG